MSVNGKVGRGKEGSLVWLGLVQERNPEALLHHQQGLGRIHATKLAAPKIS